jgi:hypothetical protein
MNLEFVVRQINTLFITVFSQVKVFLWNIRSPFRHVIQRSTPIKHRQKIQSERQIEIVT